jgi:hypothetical protein
MRVDLPSPSFWIWAGRNIAVFRPVIVSELALVRPSGCRMSDGARKTRDHHVPRMYLRRFARSRSGKSVDQIGAATPDLRTRFVASIGDVAAERGFYWV